MNRGALRKERIADTFGKAESYDNHSSLQRTVATTLASHLANTDHKDWSALLEIGCGTGHLTQALVSTLPECRITATDISPGMLARCKNKLACAGHQVQFSVVDGEHPPALKDWPLVCSSMTFQWFENLDATLRLYHTMMKPTATLAFAIPAEGSLAEWIEFTSRHNLAVGVPSFPSRHNLSRRVEEAGFSVVTCVEESIAEEFENPLSFLRSIKKTGASIPSKHYAGTAAAALRTALCREQERPFRCTWKVLFVVALNQEPINSREVT
jgi:malonyl-CoA O-methyltransferase